MRPQDAGPAESTEAVTPPRRTPAGLEPFELHLVATPDAGAVARAAVSAWVGVTVSSAVRIDLLLLISELVTNSVRHADARTGAPISVRAEVCGDTLRVEVGDEGSRGMIARGRPDLGFGGGFGLNVVDFVSRRWGVDRDAGTLVWAELAFQQAG
jgi:anti-sigma regulatory factor (Ser/Thr protein kinase)